MADLASDRRSDRNAMWDLNVNETQLEPQTMRERAATAVRLGFDGIAFIHQAPSKLTDRDRCSIKAVDFETILSAAQGVQEAHNRRSQHGNPHRFQQLTRINIPVDDANVAQSSCSNAAIVTSYDLLAVQPQSERSFAQACSSLEVDIISLDLSKRWPFKFKPAQLQQAISRGIHFEVVYGATLRDAASRRQLFANAQALTRETRGKNIIVSSGARSAMDLRGPYDVINLATFLGLTEQQAHQAISKNCQAVVQHAVNRKAYRGVMTIQIRNDAGISSQEKLTGSKRPAEAEPPA